MLLVIPAAIQAEPARFDGFLELQVATERSRYSRTALHERIVRMIRDASVRVVDPLAALSTRAAAGRPCYLRAGHWNAAGHRIEADLLVPELADVLRE